MGTDQDGPPLAEPARWLRLIRAIQTDAHAHGYADARTDAVKLTKLSLIGLDHQRAQLAEDIMALEPKGE